MRFVSPETTHINLKNGEWIDVKQDLGVGEERRFRAAGLGRMSQRKDGDQNEVDVDWAALALARVTTYLVGWSARDAKNKPVPVTPQTIQELETEDFDEINDAIQKHIADREEAKKAKSGSPTPIAPSA